MPSLLVIRLHPVEPITGDAFTSYLTGLSIAAHPVSFGNPAGTGPAFGTATYIAPTSLPVTPSANPEPTQDPANRITQHFSITPVGIGLFSRTFAAVATAVIQIPDPPMGDEFRSADIRLTITRSGNDVIHKPIYYNIPTALAPMPANPNNFPSLSPISLHLALPPLGQQVSTSVTLPEDGTAPNFATLRAAVINVLNAEPGNLINITQLTRTECRHIAYEIIWNRIAHPLPNPKSSLEEIFTGPQAPDSNDERDRRVFEGELLTYYTRHNSEAERLMNFIYSLSTALWCEEESKKATRVGFVFPVIPNSPNIEAKLILKGVGIAPLSPIFEVPAAYFYALTAILPPQVAREQRYSMVQLTLEAQIITNIEGAIEDSVLTEPLGINRFQAARRLRALGLSSEKNIPVFEVTLASNVHGLLTHWLGRTEADINLFWGSLIAADIAGHLSLVLSALTEDHDPLINAIKAPAPFGVSHVSGLAAKTNSDWETLLQANMLLLPEFTKPGTTAERTQAFIRHLRKFFDVANVFDSPPMPTAQAARLLERPSNPLDALLVSYPGGFSFNSWNTATLATTLNTIFPGDLITQQKFTHWLLCIQNMIALTATITPEDLQFSVIEALWARGLTSKSIIAQFSAAGFSLTEFKEALTGSVAYDYAAIIWNNAGIPPALNPTPHPDHFKPVNSDGSLTNCIPPPHRSPLGPIAYLHELLKVSAESTCQTPIPSNQEQSLSDLLVSRRGPLGNLLATKANLEVPLPLIDLVNESLEYMVANSDAFGAVFNTNRDKNGGHFLTSTTQPSADIFLHDPEKLFEALPEHSTPFVPTKAQAAYDKLKIDFSSCLLPYHQPLDISRTYLRQLGTRRYHTMRRFRKDITEFVLDPAKETAEFQKHLWRYPVRIETAIEYLCLSPEEYATLFQGNISTTTMPTTTTPAATARRRGRATRSANNLTPLHTMYGFSAEHLENSLENNEEVSWTDTVVHLDEFLKRTCLTYCEFIALWKSEFVKFRPKVRNRRVTHTIFPDCEPCCLDEYIIEFIDPSDSLEALKQLIIFIRLWKKLQCIANANYTFNELRDICVVLQLFIGLNVNPDFIRQLAAFQMLRDDFKLSLTDGTPLLTHATGSERLHLLAFWAIGSSKWSWAVEHLLYQIQQYAIKKHHCGCRAPEFIKLLASNLGALSHLMGFNPLNPLDSWHAHPTHTLRFAEVLAKIYASEFKVEELLYIFTIEPHLQGDDPFPHQTDNEAKDFPFGLPDDEDENSLYALRNKLMGIEVSFIDASTWSWGRMTSVLKEEFGFAPTPAHDPWLSFGQHFFPDILAQSGMTTSPIQRQYRVTLHATSEAMWNTPLDGPFHYDITTQELWTELPLTDAAILTKISRIRQLTLEEQAAVRTLYFLPRVDMAHFSFIFQNFGEAEEQLLQEPDVNQRWILFQMEFARFYQRSQMIAEHLAHHVNSTLYVKNAEGTHIKDTEDALTKNTVALAKLLLKHLWADENKALTPWEKDSGESPLNMTWQPKPNSGAYAALLGLPGTGMEAEYFDANKVLCLREVRGGIEVFGSDKNAWNAPRLTILPSMGLTLTAQQLKVAAIRNGFSLANTNGTIIGGAEPFILRWKGLMLIECGGLYSFSAGAPTPAQSLPSFEQIQDSHRWRIILKRGQKTWILLAHDWPHEEAPSHCAASITLKKGFYELSIELERKPLAFDSPEDLCPAITGFQLKYKGLDTAEDWLTVPYNKLFQAQKNDTLSAGLKVSGAFGDFLHIRYTSTVRDIRRTYQRAYKALLLVSRLQLRAEKIADDGQSELDYLLAHAENFAGYSYYRNGMSFITHKAYFDPNFLPILDNYYAPSVTQDQRVTPTPQRRQALFDWWERLFDYTSMRKESAFSPEQPAWLLFHEAAETHIDHPAQLLRHLGVDIRHHSLVLKYFDSTEVDLSYDITSTDLGDDRWAVRIWQCEKWIRGLLFHFYPRDITEAKVFLWVSDGPHLEGNANLTQFYRDGCIENGEPRRYPEIKQLNDSLRLKGRQALVAYLTHLNRVPLGAGEFAASAKHLSDLLLMDVETGLCQKASRIEEAVTAIALFIQRARLGLEPSFMVTHHFTSAWESHFVSYHIWEACKRRLIYQENWIEWDELKKAQKTEAFQFLTDELRSATLTMPVPGGMAYWVGQRPPAHAGLTLLQHRKESIIQLLTPSQEGLGLLGTPDRHAEPSWLAPLSITGSPQTPTNPDNPDNPDGPVGILVPRRATSTPQTTTGDLPMWLEAAVRLGTKFIRVAAASIPPASTNFWPKCEPAKESACCKVCGKLHPALIDEYYFWLEVTSRFDEQEQIAEWGATASDPQTDWHRENERPRLLYWESRRMVHLRWCRVHNGEFQPPRKSYEGLSITASGLPTLVFKGRRSDSLNFEVMNSITPTGFPASPLPGFRYDLAEDAAVVLPMVITPSMPSLMGGLAAFPFFAWFDIGAPLLPVSLFSPAVTVAEHLRAHCRFENALRWYELIYHPLLHDNAWMTCQLACCCVSDLVSENKTKNRAVLLHYLETLMQWGEAMMRKNTPEAFQKARVIFDTAARLLGVTPEMVLLHETALVHDSLEAKSVLAFEPACAPLNPRLMCLYSAVDDRLSMIHTCLNAKRLKNGRPNLDHRPSLDMPYFGDSHLRDCWKTTPETCADEADWCLPHSCYRFLVLVQKAQELAAEVRALGGALLIAYEKGDAEYLSAMRITHERQLFNLTLETRQLQWREADWQVQALEKTKEIVQIRLHYYKTLITNGLIGGEIQYEPVTIASSTVRTAGNVSVAIGQFMNLIPDPHVGFPCNFVKLPPGEKLSHIFSAVGTIANTVAEILSSAASLGLTKSGWDRREDDWQHQADLLTVEDEQVTRQILAAERRRDIAYRELNNHQRQVENAAEVHDFLRDKFTNHALFLWMQKETSAIYYKMYELSLHTARQAERAFNYERGHTSRRFIPSELWDNLHEGLLVGERLQLGIRQMEKAYYDENCREYELTKHISLRLQCPHAFLRLKLTGCTEIEIPEWMFDLDYPGHYLRRIKNVTITIPCVVGPYTGIHCRMTLLSSSTRVDPRLNTLPDRCCAEDLKKEGQRKNAYQALPDDPRMVKQYAATEAIATSTGQRDGGLFELNFRDERYLPFEFSGAVSRWRIELPPENNHFDLNTLSDLIMHLSYTAREGGDLLRAAANEVAQKHLPGDGVRLFDLKQEWPLAWPLFSSESPCSPKALYSPESSQKKLRLTFSQNMFPFLTKHRPISIERIELLFEAENAYPSAHMIVKFMPNRELHCQKGQGQGQDSCDMQDIICIASKDWPCLYYGVLDLNLSVLELKLGTLSLDEKCDLGTLLFPQNIGIIRRAYLICGYTANAPQASYCQPLSAPVEGAC